MKTLQEFINNSVQITENWNTIEDAANKIITINDIENILVKKHAFPMVKKICVFGK